MKYFISCTRNGSTCFLSFEGQDQGTIRRLLVDLGATNILFIPESEYPAQ